MSRQLIEVSLKTNALLKWHRSSAVGSSGQHWVIAQWGLFVAERKCQAAVEECAILKQQMSTIFATAEKEAQRLENLTKIERHEERWNDEAARQEVAKGCQMWDYRIEVALQKMTKCDLDRAWVAWRKNAAEQRVQVALICQCLMRMAHLQLGVALSTWRASALQMAFEQRRLGGALQRMMQRALSGGWNSWLESVAEAKAAEVLLSKSISRLRHSSLYAAFMRWYTLGLAAAVEQQQMLQVMLHMMSGKLSFAWRRWRKNTIASKAAHSSLRLVTLWSSQRLLRWGFKQFISSCANERRILTLPIQIWTLSLRRTAMQGVRRQVLSWHFNTLIHQCAHLKACARRLAMLATLLHYFHDRLQLSLRLQGYIKWWRAQCLEFYKMKHNENSIRLVFKEALAELQVPGDALNLEYIDASDHTSPIPSIYQSRFSPLSPIQSNASRQTQKVVNQAFFP